MTLTPTCQGITFNPTSVTLAVGEQVSGSFTMTAASDAATGARTIAVSVSEPDNMGGLSTFDVWVGVGSTHAGDRAILITLFSATNGGVEITMETGGSGDYTPGETVTGGTSGSTAMVAEWSSESRNLIVYDASASFSDGESISGGSSGASWTSSSSTAGWEDKRGWENCEDPASTECANSDPCDDGWWMNYGTMCDNSDPRRVTRL